MSREEEILYRHPRPADRCDLNEMHTLGFKAGLRAGRVFDPVAVRALLAMICSHGFQASPRELGEAAQRVRDSEVGKPMPETESEVK